jgi:hypothetical protein
VARSSDHGAHIAHISAPHEWCYRRQLTAPNGGSARVLPDLLGHAREGIMLSAQVTTLRVETSRRD